MTYWGNFSDGFKEGIDLFSAMDEATSPYELDRIGPNARRRLQGRETSDALSTKVGNILGAVSGMFYGQVILYSMQNLAKGDEELEEFVENKYRV